MKKILLLISLAIPLSLSAQKTKPNKQETFEYIRTKLISLCPDFRNKPAYLDISFDINDCTISVTSWANVSFDSTLIAKIFFSNLDANGISWDIWDLNEDGGKTNNKVLSLKLIPKVNSFSLKVYDNNMTFISNQTDPVYFLFDLTKAADITDFQEKMNKAIKWAIELCGGKKEEDLFGK